MSAEFVTAQYTTVWFFDTNIILYLLEEGEKAEIATGLLQKRGVISVQVLNEALANCRRKAGMSWEEAGAFLKGVRYFCDICDVTVETHDLGLALAARYQFSVYDAMIVAAALSAGCTTLYSEDLQHGMVIADSLQIVNPFQALT
ncbi:PIN domain-containing protein [Roseovarius sp. 10]|jgi:predicted nucleic acid-binding protein|uniref:PIN domain-containing protein n=1 Tax=Roseovarius sp. 10 TaxID=3080563 RepID=UPI002953EBBF|nr:PIN domain-containing protein [Roseovarius sp. 10]MDV7200183.1 PIN domain-containing protein [Roseovarius sp. 10]